ncbi:kinase-like domain-containing protein [Russula vinacea]|nr:kinase-like domain-containing protein [Russula vinacea]
MVDDWSQAIQHDVMRIYRAKRDEAHRSVTLKYTFLSKDEDARLHAIKKFKPDKDGDIATYTGISQSAIREIARNMPRNIVALKEVILEDKSIYMVFEYAEHDFLQVIHHYSQTLRSHIPHDLLKSLIFQLLNGLLYLHDSHILHRDLKPANILITSTGIVKIGDLGLALVVTIWYRSPELLMGSKHYHKAVDCWAVGCVMAELASLRPIFKGEEAKLDSKKNVPFQKDQLLKVIEVLGKPDEREWPGMKNTPEYHNVKRLEDSPNRLDAWCKQRSLPPTAVNFLSKLFIYDPDKRMKAREALSHSWFQEDPQPTYNVFQHQLNTPAQLPPHRRIALDEAPSMMPAQATHAQHFPAQFTQPQHLPGQTHGSGTSLASLSVGHGGHTRKKARLG